MGSAATATLTVSSVTIGGRPAPGCVSAGQTFPITGSTVSGSLSCDSSGAGPIYDAVSAQAQEEADREAQNSGGTATVPFSAYAEVDADALAAGEADQLIDQQNQERQEADCRTPNSFAAGTPVLLADGSTRPIDRITRGSRVLTTDVASGQPADEPVLARITTSGPKGLADVTVTDGRRTGTVTATANHPFWDVARDTWTLAGDIRPGEVLDSPADGGPVRATANPSGGGNSPAAALKLARQAVANGNYMQTQWELVQIEHDGLLGRVQFYDKLEPWTRNIVWR